MPWVGSIGLDLGAQSAHVHVDQSAIAEVVVTPDLVEQAFPAEDAAWVLGELTQQSELRLGQMQFDAGAGDLTLVRDDLQITEDQASVAGADGTDPPQQGTDSCRQLLWCERLGEVIVRAGFEPG